MSGPSEVGGSVWVVLGRRWGLMGGPTGGAGCTMSGPIEGVVVL